MLYKILLVIDYVSTLNETAMNAINISSFFINPLFTDAAWEQWKK